METYLEDSQERVATTHISRETPFTYKVYVEIVSENQVFRENRYYKPFRKLNDNLGVLSGGLGFSTSAGAAKDTRHMQTTQLTQPGEREGGWGEESSLFASSITAGSQRHSFRA